MAATDNINQTLPKAEQRKLDSSHLREPLLTELANDDIRFTEDAVQLLKFHGSYQQNHRELRKTDKVRCWQMMLRLRNPGGRVPAQLFLALDDLSNRLGDGTLRATTRQAFQMHGIPKADLKEVIGTIVRNLGSTLAACGDINRNVMAPPAPFEKGGTPRPVNWPTTSLISSVRKQLKGPISTCGSTVISATASSHPGPSARPVSVSQRAECSRAAAMSPSTATPTCLESSRLLSRCRVTTPWIC